MIVNGLPWEGTEIILLFLRLHPSTAFQTVLLTMSERHLFGHQRTKMDWNGSI